MDRVLVHTPRLLSLVFVLSLAPACSKDEPSRGPTAAPSSATSADKPAPSASAVTAAGKQDKPAGRDGNDPLYHPERATLTAPDKFRVEFTTSKGNFIIEVTRAWSPNGADRFFNLVKLGFYDGVRFHRAIDDFMVQFGIHPEPAVNGAWYKAFLEDDPVVESNRRSYVTFAHAGKNSRTTQIFISYVDKQRRLDKDGFSPFGKVVEGMNVVDSLYKGYGELAPKGKGPNASRVQREGQPYLDAEFPKLDYIQQARVL